MDEQISSHVRDLMKGTALEYLDQLVSYLEDKNLIRLEKLTYYEMCLRRNAGVHSGWIGNKDYNNKLKQIKKRDTGSQLDFLPNETDFLGFDYDYFISAYKKSKNLITELKQYCETKFTRQGDN